MSKRQIALLSNVTAELVGQRLARNYDVYIPAGYNTWVAEALNANSELYQRACDAIVIILDGTWEMEDGDIDPLADQLELWERAIKYIAKNVGGSPIFVSTLDLRTNAIRALSEKDMTLSMQNRWHEMILDMAKEYHTIYPFDLARLVVEMGRANFYSKKMWYLANMPYSMQAIKAISAEIEFLLGSAFEPRKKLIILDLDNTLWGGLAGEDGIEGVQLSRHKEGARFRDFQKRLLQMKQRGTLLGICSKNNPDDALEIIQKHPDMVLREDDFVAMEINWENKSDNILHIAKQLNLTEGSILFIDDNPVERELVRARCPAVCTPEFPQDSAELPEYADQLYKQYIRPLHILREDTQKTEMYHAQEKRRREQEKSESYEDYLKKLEMVVDIHAMAAKEQPRVAQLCQKTNQFNLTTKRYSESDIERLNSEPDTSIFVVNVRDKFGDEGLVSVVIAKQEQRQVIFDTFLMSCRVMGRELERAIMQEILRYYAEKADLAVGRYVRTAKNAPVEKLYDLLGFELVDEKNGEKTYRRELNSFVYQPSGAYEQVIFYVE